MKFQTGAEYFLNEQFSSPLWDFLKDEANTEIITQAMEKWLSPTLKRPYIETTEDYVMEFMVVSQIGLPYEQKSDGIYVSGMCLVIKHIVEFFLSKLPNPINIEPVIKLLNGNMYHEYFTTGKYGEIFFDDMDIAMEKLNNKKPTDGKDRKLIEVWNEIIPLYLEEVENKKELDDLIKVNEILSKIRKEKNLPLSKIDFDVITRVWGRKNTLLKVSKEGIDFAKKSNCPEERIKGLRQTRIERGTDFMMTLLVAIITNIYFEKELFLYYNPYMYEMGICDRKGLDLNRPDVYLTINFGQMVNTIFCKHCLKKFIGKHNIKLSSKSKDNQEIIKNMFDDLYNLASDVCPDDLNITMEGKVIDKSRYSEVEEAIEFGKVGLEKYAGKKGGVTFSVNKDLKKYKKKLK